MASPATPAPRESSSATGRSSTPPSKRRRLRAAALRGRLWNRTRWTTLAEEEASQTHDEQLVEQFQQCVKCHGKMVFTETDLQDAMDKVAGQTALILETRFEERFQDFENLVKSKRYEDEELRRKMEEASRLMADNMKTVEEPQDDVEQNFEVGDCVVLVGLQNSPELNGKVGHLSQYHVKKDRWEVYLDTDRKPKLLRQENLCKTEPSWMTDSEDEGSLDGESASDFNDLCGREAL